MCIHFCLLAVCQLIHDYNIVFLVTMPPVLFSEEDIFAE